MRLLIVDDDTELCELLRQYLENEGLRADAVHDGERGLQSALNGGYDLVILDVMMPKMNGMEMLRELRKSSAIPVIMLTARGEETDRIVGLELGADDYLPKPFNPRELAARIRAVLRRQAPATESGDTIVVDSLEWRARSRSICEHGEPLPLTSTEYDVLALLLQRNGEVVGKAEMSEAALGKKLGPYDRTLDVHIAHLRKKMAPLADGSPRIKTIRAIGWMLVRE